MKNFLAAFILLASLQIIDAKEKIDTVDQYIKGNALISIYHQHHDFFRKPFSFQGCELSWYLSENFYIGAYGSCFVSNLKSRINNQIQYIWIGQTGLLAGFVTKKDWFVNPGLQLNVGIFSLRYDDFDFGLLETNKANVKLNGYLFAPQVFVETKIKEWFSLRTGLSYNIYIFNQKIEFPSNELNNISFTFGLVFNF